MFLKENLTVMPRVWMSYKPFVDSSDESTIKTLSDSTFNYREAVIVDRDPELKIDTIPGKNKVQITGYELNKISISAETDKNGMLVLSEIFYPSWKVYVDGIEKPILRCDYSLRAVAIEKGKHQVIFEYVDKDFKTGSILCLSGLGIVLIGLGFTFRNKTKKAAI
jgi:uncharacterized membrane protein YfhO